MRIVSWFWIHVFLVLLLFVWLLRGFFSRRDRSARQLFAQEALYTGLSGTLNSQRRSLKKVLLLLALFLIFFALARPQWGTQFEMIKRRGLDIMIAMDLSASMLATDIKPNRLERAKLAVKDFLRYLKGDRIGLIAFAGDAVIACPLTSDYGGFILNLDNLKAADMPVGGTNIGSAIRQAEKAYRASAGTHKIFILITDGEDHQGRTLELAEAAKKKGIVIYTIGIGTPEGELIPAGQGAVKDGYLKDRDGNVVKTRLNEKLLEELAVVTGGVYVRATPKEFGLEYLYGQKFADIERRELESRTVKYYQDRFQLFVALALVLLLCERILTERTGS